MALIIYDNNGKIYNYFTAGYELPAGGIQYLETEIPVGRYPIRVDTTVTPHQVVLSEEPRDLVQEKLTQLEQNTLTTKEFSMMTLEAVATVYEMVQPFLP